MVNFADIIREKRIEKNISQGELANRLHVTKQAVSKWENGKAMPDISLMPEIAEILGVSVDELLTGKEPEKQIVEKIVIQEKEVVKPFPKKRLFAIVAPIVIAMILASALMGVYIPKAIEANRPPVENTLIDDPEPPIVIPEEPDYTEIYVVSSGEDATDIHRVAYYRSTLDKENTAYFLFKPQFNSDYMIDITALKNAKIYLDGEEILSFDSDKTVTYSKYLEKGGEHKIIVDVSACTLDGNYYGHEIRIRQKLEYDDITVRANSEYAFAVQREELSRVRRLFIESPEIKFTSVRKTKRGENVLIDKGVDSKGNVIYGYIQAQTGTAYSNLNQPLFDLGEGVSHIEAFICNIGNTFGENGDYVIVMTNHSDKDVKLLMREEDVEKVSFGQLVRHEAVDALPHYYQVDETFVGNDNMRNELWCYFTDKNKDPNHLVEASWANETVMFCLVYAYRDWEAYCSVGLSLIEEGWRVACINRAMGGADGEYLICIRAFESNDFEFILSDGEIQEMPEI